MAVLVQEVINTDYAFVIHTTNPSSGDASEIYVEVVKGLGETLIGAYPRRALSFISKKHDLNSPQIFEYPSKPIGLFIRWSIIFRSDSNGEDLEGYAGAGLYDRCSVLFMQRGKAFYDFQFNNTRLVKSPSLMYDPRERSLTRLEKGGTTKDLGFKWYCFCIFLQFLVFEFEFKIYFVFEY
ncbi:alpha-glucan water dikinase, chloroplastic-like isoform X3 [Arachis stenosperma]|nr:alpha-glucan water dikinase, chloroplastic-like isoform X3 [Arachis stenosperma]XP_057722359.1 alpha-glucan water dikinase, chloroplastic-like isoform X3 [Arachis stenosperma]